MSGARQTRARIYHASDLYALPALSAAAQSYGARLVYDARELYPHVVATIGRPLVRHFWRLVEGRFIKGADAVFTVSEGIADRLAAVYGIDRPILLHNVPERGGASGNASLRDALHPTAHTIILHLGQMRPHRGCELLVDAMRDVEGGILVFLGDGPLRESLRRKAKESHIEGRVHFLDPVPPDEVLSYAKSADVGVTLLEDVCLNHRLALPNKLFEYLSAGVPVIASDLPEIRKIVRGYDVGQVVRPGSRDDLVAALKLAVLDRSLREQWQRHIPALLETFNWESASHRFLEVYNELLSD